MGNGTQELYSIIIQNIETNEIEKSFIWLNKRDAKKMQEKTNEIVYSYNEKNKFIEWKLVELNKK